MRRNLRVGGRPGEGGTFFCSRKAPAGVPTGLKPGQNRVREQFSLRVETVPRCPRCCRMPGSVRGAPSNQRHCGDDMGLLFPNAWGQSTQGDPKGKAFGTRVEELVGLRRDESNPHAIKLFGGMSPDEIEEAIRIVLCISDERICQAVAEAGGSPLLAEKMIARKAAMTNTPALMKTDTRLR